MSSYMSFALKYRPSKFEEISGQDVLVDSLSNAIKNEKVASAFLLVGIRGVGKTSTARIIAKSLNCKNRSNGVEPCNECESCNDIMCSVHPDVIEIDAASYTGVDDIRQIIENTRYVPSRGEYKVFIIDECHMLSRSAMNALLKTLEEPTACVKFILATTELVKVPATIVSRCQRFILNRLSVKKISLNMSKITECEGINISEEALFMIAQNADGSMRDALSMLGQINSYIGDNQIMIDKSIVEKVLGLPPNEVLCDMVSCIFVGDASKLLNYLDDMHERGFDLVIIMERMLYLLHLITRVIVSKDLLNSIVVSEGERNFVILSSDKVEFSKVMRLWQALLKGLQEVKISPGVYHSTAVVLARLCYIGDLPITFSKKEYSDISSKNDIVELFKKNSRMDLYEKISSEGLNDGILTDFTKKSIIVVTSLSMTEELAKDIACCLQSWIGKAWSIAIQKGDSCPSESCSVVRKVLDEFSGSRIVKVY